MRGHTVKRNTNLFLAIADTIERHPELHAQEVWAEHRNDCGTAACIAGHAILKAKPHWLNTSVPDWVTDSYEDVQQWGLSINNDAVRAEGLYPGWEAMGAHVLGLHAFEADVLFDGSASPRDHIDGWPEALRRIAAGAEIDEVIER